MTNEERMMEVAKLRLRFRMNNRLRLESLAMLSRLFREHNEPIADELLASIVFAVPEELMGEAEGAPGSEIKNFVQNPPHHPLPRDVNAPTPPKNPPPHPHETTPPPPPKNPPPHPPARPRPQTNPPSHPPMMNKKNKIRPPTHP